MRTNDLEVRAGVHAHLDLVVGAGEELGEAGAEWDLATCGETCADADHVLLSDFAFDEAVCVCFVLREGFGEG